MSATTTTTETKTSTLRLRPTQPDALDLKATYNDWRDDLVRDGYVILKGAVPRDRALEYRGKFHEVLEQWGLGYKEEDRSTWVPEHLPTVRNGGMFDHSIGHEGFVWEIRQEPGVIEPFAKLWGTDKLLTSFDGANLSLPGAMQPVDPAPWYHIDQDPHKRGFHCAQGLVNLTENGPHDGGLIVLQGSHKLNDEYFDTVWDGSQGSVHPDQTDFFYFDEQVDSWFQQRGAKWIKLELEPGDLVIWDSRTAHYNVPPRGERDRCAVYTCYAPAALCEPDQLALKQELFNNRMMSTHWPHKNLCLKPTTIQRNGAPCPYVHSKPTRDPELNDTVLRLAGVKAY